MLILMRRRNLPLSRVLLPRGCMSIPMQYAPTPAALNNEYKERRRSEEKRKSDGQQSIFDYLGSEISEATDTSIALQRHRRD